MRPTTTASLASLLVGAAVLLGACGSDSDATAAPVGPETEAESGEAEDAIVTIERSRYAPEEIEVAAGAEVTFENLDAFAHTVTSAEGSSISFDSGDLPQGESFAQRFDEAGTYDYFCVIHPTMRATVVVG